MKAQFIEPMLLRRSGELPEGPAWVYELKLDGYRAIAFKSGNKVHLRSRNDKDFDGTYPEIARALASLPDRRSLTAKSWRWTNGASLVMCSQSSGRRTALVLPFRNSTLNIHPAQLADIKNGRDTAR
jgi:hypothetical protein